MINTKNVSGKPGQAPSTGLDLSGVSNSQGELVGSGGNYPESPGTSIFRRPWRSAARPSGHHPGAGETGRNGIGRLANI